MAYDLLSPVTDGARRELEQILLPVENGVRKENESVRYKIDGAWREVWSAIKTPVAKVGNIVMTDTAEYSYSIDTPYKMSYSITTPSSGGNHIPFKITKRGGFGKTIKVRYTMKQTLSLDANASLLFCDQNYEAMTRDKGAFYWYSSSSLITRTGTVTLDTEQEYIYLIVEAHTSNIVGYIENLYINDELVTFK